MKPLEFEVEGGGGAGRAERRIFGENGGDLSSSTEYKREL